MIKKKPYIFVWVFLISSWILNASSFRFSPPEVIKASWNARTFISEDLNQDGLNDLLFFNLDRSRIEILYRTKDGKVPERVNPVQRDRWNPDLEDAPYKKEFIFVPESLTALAVGDLNGDGFLDVIQGSPEHGVYIHFRNTDLKWEEPIEIETSKLRSSSNSIKVVEGKVDRLTKLFLFTEVGLEMIPFKKGKPQYPSTLFREESKSANGLHILDINNDELDDWLYLNPGKERSIRLRFGIKDGFGPEHSYDLSLFSFNPIPRQKKNRDFKFVGIDQISKEVAVFSLGPRQKKKETPPFETLSYDLFPEDAKKSTWTMADFNSDGKWDVVAASPKLGELLFLEGRGINDFGLPQKNPSLKGITSLSACRFSSTKSPGLVILSPEEKIIGLSEFVEKKRFSFPKPLAIEGDAVLSNCADLNQDNLDEIIVIVEKRSDFFLQIWSIEKGKKYQLSYEIELEEWRREPSAIFPCFLDDDDLIDLVLLSDREAAQILLNNGKGKVELVGIDSALRKSILLEKTRSRIGTGDVDGDSSPELLIAGEGMVRALKWKKGELQVIEQFNSSDPQAELNCPLFEDLDGDQEKELIYFSSGYWEAVKKTSGGSFKNVYKIEEDIRSPEVVYSLSGDDPKNFFSFSSSGFQVIGKSITDGDCYLNIHSRYLTDLPKITHGGVDWGDFDNDGEPDLICMDGRKHVLEFLSFSKSEEAWKSILHFKVFEEDLHYRGKKGGVNEPRDGLIADLDGDGRDDLVLLVHDRFLCYYQSKEAGN